MGVCEKYYVGWKSCVGYTRDAMYVKDSVFRGVSGRTWKVCGGAQKDWGSHAGEAQVGGMEGALGHHGFGSVHTPLNAIELYLVSPRYKPGKSEKISV